MALPKTQMQHHHVELTGVKGFLHSVEQGLKLYGTVKGVYDVGRAVYQGAQYAAPIIAGLL
jgi:hypothetical protein